MIKIRKNGFTLIELLVVATILIVLMTIGFVSYSQANRSSRNAKRKSDLETVRQALVLYLNDNGTYPDVGINGNNNAFQLMLVEISDYISFETLEDPINETPYKYTYGTVSAPFIVCTYLELPDGPEQYCVENP